MLQGEHAERCALFVDAPLPGEQRAQRCGGDAVYFDVYVLGRAPHYLVAHIAADKIGAAAFRGYILRQAAGDLQFLHAASKTVQGL